jgi:predicted CopG family antitoxin
MIERNTTIQVSKDVRDKISSFGSRDETFDQILRRIYNLAVKEQLREFLMSSKGYVSIDEAIKEAEEKWPESK